MAVFDTWKEEVNAVEGAKVRARALRFLDMLQGAFQLTWERPEELQKAMAELSATEETIAGRDRLVSYLDALSPCLSRPYGVRGREGETDAAQQAKGRHRQTQGVSGARGGSSSTIVAEVSEISRDGEKMVPEQGLSPAALGQDDEMDTDVGEEAGMRRDEKTRLVLAQGGGADVTPSRCSMGKRRRESSVQSVLGDRDLLGCVLSYVGGKTGRQSVSALGQVVLVCRRWREVSALDGSWRKLEEEVVPALWQEEQRGRQTVGRGRLVQYGRLLVAERRLWTGRDWAAGLELHVEVFDRMDGLQMMSVRGKMRWVVDPLLGAIVFFLAPLPAVEVRGSSFSAASRDPEQRRLANIAAYFTEGHLLEYPCSLCVRLTVRDQRTGKGGLLWEEGKDTVRLFQDMSPAWQNMLPEGSQAIVSTAVDMVGGRVGEGLHCNTNMYICPEPDQEGVAEVDRLYRIATGGDNIQRNDHPFRFLLKTMSIAQTGSVLRSLMVQDLMAEE